MTFISKIIGSSDQIPRDLAPAKTRSVTQQQSPNEELSIDSYLTQMVELLDQIKANADQFNGAPAGRRNLRQTLAQPLRTAKDLSRESHANQRKILQLASQLYTEDWDNDLNQVIARKLIGSVHAPAPPHQTQQLNNNLSQTLELLGNIPGDNYSYIAEDGTSQSVPRVIYLDANRFTVYSDGAPDKGLSTEALLDITLNLSLGVDNYSTDLYHEKYSISQAISAMEILSKEEYQGFGLSALPVALQLPTATLNKEEVIGLLNELGSVFLLEYQNHHGTPIRTTFAYKDSTGNFRKAEIEPDKNKVRTDEELANTLGLSLMTQPYLSIYLIDAERVNDFAAGKSEEFLDNLRNIPR